MKSRITRALTIMLIFFSLCGLAACELPIPRQFTKEYREAFNKAPIVEATSSYFNKVSLNDKIQLKYFEDKMYVE